MVKSKQQDKTDQSFCKQQVTLHPLHWVRIQLDTGLAGWQQAWAEQVPRNSGFPVT